MRFAMCATHHGLLWSVEDHEVGSFGLTHDAKPRFLGRYWRDSYTHEWGVRKFKRRYGEPTFGEPKLTEPERPCSCPARSLFVVDPDSGAI